MNEVSGNNRVVTLVVFSGAADILLTQKGVCIYLIQKSMQPSIVTQTVRKQEIERANWSLKRAKREREAEK